ncbi:uncharacterized protein LOC119701640 [Motacilla alba alba]|uniref:uncharacterized protein LOC119701640 n=1 Tax=Motacilla alba alba TaxID=1094192 RepID=UPI0018D4F3DD|nr:uncharacterized protein LOC119701640 [Motacilla alba alba]XP_037994551.1 uncharacterized protein LOC119701640 [Motacilla alba alba]XP_037994552.1 uncharacterized protein LOC119701640 [Motacilla alba alba]XP_037994553.1 uncharacterized protein LOC119701640 [Motacilla alba alba]
MESRAALAWKGHKDPLDSVIQFHGKEHIPKCLLTLTDSRNVFHSSCSLIGMAVGSSGRSASRPGQEKPLNSSHLCPELWCLSSQTQRAPACTGGPLVLPVVWGESPAVLSVTNPEGSALVSGCPCPGPCSPETPVPRAFVTLSGMWWQPREQGELGTGAVPGTDPGQVSVSLGGWPHTWVQAGSGSQVLHFVPPESSCPPWGFPAGLWQRREQNQTCSSRGHCWPWSLCCAIGPWHFAAVTAAATPAGGCVPLAALPSPTTSSSGASVPSWECLLGMCLSPGSILLFQSRQAPELLGFSASGLDCRSPWKEG